MSFSLLPFNSPPYYSRLWFFAYSFMARNEFLFSAGPCWWQLREAVPGAGWWQKGRLGAKDAKSYGWICWGHKKLLDVFFYCPQIEICFFSSEHSYFNFWTNFRFTPFSLNLDFLGGQILNKLLPVQFLFDLDKNIQKSWEFIGIYIYFFLYCKQTSFPIGVRALECNGEHLKTKNT